MVRFLLRFLAVAAAVLVASYIVEGITVSTFWPTAVLAALVLGLLNITIRPLLVLVTLPINLLTLGLFTFILNALVFWLLNFMDGVSIDGFVPALLGSLIVTAVKWVVDAVFS